MTNYPHDAYGSNPHANINPNDDHGWGNYHWPGGVPGNLMGTAVYQGAHSRASAQCRKELVPLFQLLWEIADKKHGYTVYGSPNPSGEPTWGPWGYENRAIGGTSTASNHSRGKAMDINAPRNPQSHTFQSDMPPGMVHDFEACGMYWGGRYGGGTKYDAMHFEYCFSPGDVANHIAKAREILGGQGSSGGGGGGGQSQPQPHTEEDDMARGYKVVRRQKNLYDYAYSDRTFFLIESEEHYNSLRKAGLIQPEHGQAPVIDDNLLGFIAAEAARGLPGQQARVDDIR